MTHKRCILLLGTDLGDKKNNLHTAKRLVINNVGEIINSSKIIETEPLEFTSETIFLNQVLEVETKMSPIELLKSVKEVEKIMGRIYKKPKEGERYTSRIIDIDILFYENISFKSKNLIIPHCQVSTRPFVQILLNNMNFNDFN